MGWLFAVALGMQEKSRRATLAAILPIALGHALAIGVVVSLLWVAQKNLPMQAMRYGAAAIIFGFGCYRLVRFLPTSRASATKQYPRFGAVSINC